MRGNAERMWTLQEYDDALVKTESQLVDRDATIKHLRGKAEFDMPPEMRGRFHNGRCPDACDMIDGPCACGASHRAKEWILKLAKQLADLRKQCETCEVKKLEADAVAENKRLREAIEKAIPVLVTHIRNGNIKNTPGLVILNEALKE